MKKSPEDLSGISGKVKVMEMCSTLNELKNEEEVEKFVDKWRADYLKEAKDGFITSKVDEISKTLMYFLLINDENRTLTDKNRVYFINFNRDRRKHILWFALYK
jgi:bisphosphoglycerate-independent phosphoglycerate mutase (AlkP superfamily)